MAELRGMSLDVLIHYGERIAKEQEKYGSFSRECSTAIECWKIATPAWQILPLLYELRDRRAADGVVSKPTPDQVAELVKAGIIDLSGGE